MFGRVLTVVVDNQADVAPTSCIIIGGRQKKGTHKSVSYQFRPLARPKDVI